MIPDGYLLAPPDLWPIRAIDPVGYLVAEWIDGIPIFATPGQVIA